MVWPLLKGKADVSNEIWKSISSIPGFEKYTSYEVSSLGRIRSNTKQTDSDSGIMVQTLEPGRSGSLYHRVPLSASGERKTFRVHRLVLLAFNYDENHENLTVDHINEDTQDNRLENLQWMTVGDNVRKSCVGRFRKFSDEINKEIRDKYTAGALYKDIAAEYSISIETAWRIVNNFNNLGASVGRKRNSFSLETKQEICDLYFNQKQLLKQLAEKYQCAESYISKIINQHRRGELN